jgi:hypothetical protein
VQSSPKASRPTKSYFSKGPHLLPWSWAEERLIESENYWICSTLADGRPYSRPVWGVWLDGALVFSTGSRIGTNLRERPAAEVHLESGNEVVIFDGRAEFSDERSLLAAFVDAYNRKYNWDFTVDGVGSVVSVRPRVAFGWVSDPTGLDRGAIYDATGTRWDFAQT